MTGWLALAAALAAAEPEPARGALLRSLEALAGGRSTQAASGFDRLAEKHPGLAAASYLQGAAKEAAGDQGAARAAYERALGLDGQFLEARARLAALDEKQGRALEAWRHYSRVAAADSRDPAAAAALGRLRPSVPAEKRPPAVRSLASHLPAVSPPSPGRLLRVSLATGPSGRPAALDRTAFRWSGAFVVARPGAGLLARGEAGARWTLRAAKGRVLAVGQDGKVRAEAPALELRGVEPGASVILEGLPYGLGYAWHGLADRQFRGRVEVRAAPDGRSLRLVNVVGLEEYLYGVLNSEMPSRFPEEALKAQAVIARSQALYRALLSRPHGKGHDLCDEQHCQVYGGVSAESPRARAAVDATAALALQSKGKPAHTVFFSNCGGATQSGKEAGWADLSYWKAVSDLPGGGLTPSGGEALAAWLAAPAGAYCATALAAPPEHRWTRVVAASELTARLKARGRGVGAVRRVTVSSRGVSGRARRVLVEGDEGATTISKEHEIRRLLGLGPLRSTLFAVDRAAGKAGTWFVFWGAGWGHGVGLCQAGAGGRAEAGQGFAEILSAYYPGAALAPYRD